MFDAMTQGRQSLFLFVSAQLLICVQHLVIRAVADGVNRHSETHIRGTTTKLNEPGALLSEADVAKGDAQSFWVRARAPNRSCNAKPPLRTQALG